MTTAANPFRNAVLSEPRPDVDEAEKALLDAGCDPIHLWCHLDTLRQLASVVANRRYVPSRHLRQLQTAAMVTCRAIDRVTGSLDEYVCFPPLGPSPLHQLRSELAGLNVALLG